MKQQRIHKRKAVRSRQGEWDNAADAERHDRAVRARRRAVKESVRAERMIRYLEECEATP
ncbi:hypothetical protein [Streptomyces microflavus]|uniref:hypothetical protein n=1 Tax=Streptomyces microflavus TaxID=1919 RepID=UPI003677F797